MITEQTAVQPDEVTPAAARRRCDPDSFPFATTAELAHADGLVGQERAIRALTFGLAMRGRGFNLYVAGAPGTGKTTTVRAFLEQAGRDRPTPPDWCYVHNFRDPSRPRALRLAPGVGRQLRDELKQLVAAARRDIPRAFESEEYLARREAVLGDLSKQWEQGVAQLGAHAQLVGFRLLQPAPNAIALVPVLGNQPLSDEDLAGLRPEMRTQIERHRDELAAEVSVFLKENRAAERDARARLEAHDREVALHAVGGLLEDLTDRYAEQPELSAFLQDVREGILGDVDVFRANPAGDGATVAATTEASDSLDPARALARRAFRKYEVNVVVEHADAAGAPVVVEANPTYPNLIGRVEREAVLGALMTDFTLISAGALHRANGGFLVLRVPDLLRAPMAWDALKRALREQAISLEEMGEALGLVSTRGLRPDPIPLDIKVCLIGEPTEYYLLYQLDPDFRDLFKVRADFATELERTPEHEAGYAAFAAQCLATDGMAMDRGAVARLIEESSRLVEDQRQLSARFGDVADLIAEASYWAREASATVVGAAHIRQAVEQRVYRARLIQDRLQDMIARGVVLVRPAGEEVGQVHGLAVIDPGDVPFGRPSRITATIGAGRDGVLDIERQAELGGRIHSKGILILGGYLLDRYARNRPLALSARLVFEQSYGEVEGDSASLAELIALLSRLAGVPVRQSLAVTGSINQRGEVQAIGGVNQKIEGFFDVCRTLGLTGDQGVVIPASNVEHLMLRDDVVEAMAAGRFHVYPVSSVDEAILVLTGTPAGERDAAGTFPPDSLHARVDACIQRLAEALRDFAAPDHAPAAKPHDGHAAAQPARRPARRRSTGA